jgi:DNA-binding CsgD family transcriptional regulator
MSFLLNNGACQGLRVSCGINLQQQAVIECFSAYSQQFQPEAIHLLIDHPTTWACLQLQAERAAGITVVFTDNPAPEYWEDLWDMGIDVLFAGHDNVCHGLEAGIAALQAGRRWRYTPNTPSLLTAGERKIANAVAMGLDVDEVSAKFGMGTQHVRNVLTRVNEKLRVKNQRQLSFYYTGQWHLLESLGWVPPHTL